MNGNAGNLVECTHDDKCHIRNTLALVVTIKIARSNIHPPFPLSHLQEGEGWARSRPVERGLIGCGDLETAEALREALKQLPVALV